MRALTGLAGDRERAEDALQDAIVEALRPGAIERIDRADAWLYVVACRRLHKSRLRAAVELLLSRPPSAATPPPSEDRVAALDLLRGLTARQRQIVIARYYLDLSYEDVARHFGISVGTASATVTQALKKIRRRLESDPEERKAWKTGS